MSSGSSLIRVLVVETFGNCQSLGISLPANSCSLSIMQLAV
jgi:hypothetical protein